MRSRSEVRRAFSGVSSAPNENSAATWSEPSTPSAVTMSSTPPSVPLVFATNALSSACERFSLTSVNTGTKAVLNEPSANSRRMKFGIRKATQNASVIQLTPNTALIDWSRTRPRMREMKVIALNENIERSRLGVFMPCLPSPTGRRCPKGG